MVWNRSLKAVMLNKHREEGGDEEMPRLPKQTKSNKDNAIHQEIKNNVRTNHAIQQQNFSLELQVTVSFNRLAYDAWFFLSTSKYYQIGVFNSNLLFSPMIKNNNF